MSVAWLIFRRDLRRLWPLELALGALTLFAACYPSLGVDPHDGSLLNGTELLRVALLGLMAVLLMQSDLAVTDRADWITRPMRAREIVGGKVLFVLLALILPAALVAAVSAHPYGVEWARCAGIGLESAGQVAVVALFFGLIGALTPSLLGAVNLFAAGAVALAVLGSYVAALVPSHRQIQLIWWNRAIEAAVFVGLVALLALHYRYRRTVLTVGAAVGALAALLGFQRQLAHLPPLPAPATVALRAQSPRAFLGGSLARPYPLPEEVVVGIQASYAIPPGVDGAVSIWRANFKASDGRRAGGILPSGASVHASESSGRDISSFWNGYPVAAKEWLGIDLPGRRRSSLFAVLSLPGSRLAALAGAKGALNLDCLYFPTRFAAPGFLALEAGATLRLSGYCVRLESLQAAAGPRLEIGLLTTQVHDLDTAYHDFAWALVNDASGEVSFAEIGTQYGSASSSYVGESRQSLSFAHRWRRGSSEVMEGVDARWLKSARLEYFELQRERGQSFQAVVSDFILPAVGGIR